MYHSPPRNVLIARKLLAWFISWVAVIVGVVIVSALTLGYGYNEHDGRIEQGGILQLDSKPQGATITINGIPYSSNTPTKLVSSPGEYAIKMDKPGYRTWQKTVPIQAGNITWETYPRLFPQNVEPVTVAGFNSLSGALPSGNSKHYAFLEKADQPVIAIAPLGRDTISLERITIPATIITKPKQSTTNGSYKLYLWSGNQDYLLVKHTYTKQAKKQLEWLLVNVEAPSRSININTTYGIQPTELVFGNNDGSDLIAQIGGDIRRIDLSNQTLSRPLVHDVANFRLYHEEYIIYVTKPSPNKTQRIGYVRSSFSKPVVLTTVPYDGNTTALADIGAYFDERYLLVSHGQTADFYVMKGFHGTEDDHVTLQRIASLQTPHGIIDVDVTDNGQFATVQDGYDLAVYDLEIHKQYITEIMSSTAEPQKLSHLDTYLYWGYSDGHMRTYEFDGANQYNLMPFDPRFEATFSPSGKYLYSVVEQDGKFFFQRIQMFS